MNDNKGDYIEKGHVTVHLMINGDDRALEITSEGVSSLEAIGMLATAQDNFIRRGSNMTSSWKDGHHD